MKATHVHRSVIRGRIAATALLLVLAAVLLPLTANAGPASPNITLEVQNHASNGSDGFTNTTASNGATYSYRYSGGEGNGGDVIFRSRGRVTVNVGLADAGAYSIDDVSFMGDVNQQLSWVNSGQASRAVIQDRNDRVQTAQYKITVVDEDNGASIPCDPMIANR